MADVVHKDMTGSEAYHDVAYYQSGDPGAVGAGKFWVDTSVGPPYSLKRRNAGNTSWEVLVSGIYGAYEVVLDAGGAVLSNTNVVDIEAPYDLTILHNTLTTDQVGSVVVDIQVCSYATFPASLASICASAKPTVTTAQKSQDSTLTGWTTTITRGQMVRFAVVSATAVTRATIVLAGIRN